MDSVPADELDAEVDELARRVAAGRCRAAGRAQARRQPGAGAGRRAHDAAPVRRDGCARAPVARAAPHAVPRRHGRARAEGGPEEPRRAVRRWPRAAGIRAVVRRIVLIVERSSKIRVSTKLLRLTVSHLVVKNMNSIQQLASAKDVDRASAGWPNPKRSHGDRHSTTSTGPTDDHPTPDPARRPARPRRAEGHLPRVGARPLRPPPRRSRSTWASPILT